MKTILRSSAFSLLLGISAGASARSIPQPIAPRPSSCSMKTGLATGSRRTGHSDVAFHRANWTTPPRTARNRVSSNSIYFNTRVANFSRITFDLKQTSSAKASPVVRFHATTVTLSFSATADILSITLPASLHTTGQAQLTMPDIWTGGVVQMQIYNAAGVVVISKRVLAPGHFLTMHLPVFSSGGYTLKMAGSDDKPVTKAFTIIQLKTNDDV